MTPYSPWNNCQRCERSKCRWGIYAPSANAPRVLVLSAAASRGSQAIGAPDVEPQRVASRICALYKVPTKAVHVDVLLACGPAIESEGHEVAACAQRLEDQATFNKWPLDLVVLLGHHTARCARLAGLLTTSGFRIGCKVLKSVIVRDATDVGNDRAWRVLGPSQPASKAMKMDVQHVAELLRRKVQQRCDGYSWRPLGGEWKRYKEEPPPTKAFTAHVNGQGWLAPFRPTKDWQYCVLDVDIHNAIQAAEFQATSDKLSALFKKSLFFTSSTSGGLHVYIRLPPRMPYARAAVWLTEFLFLHNILVRKSPPGPFAAGAGPLATRIVEVPVHPPRLPLSLIHI